MAGRGRGGPGRLRRRRSGPRPRPGPRAASCTPSTCGPRGGARASATPCWRRRSATGRRTCGCWRGNERAIAFYERQGFRLDGTEDEHDEGRTSRMVRAGPTLPSPPRTVRPPTAPTPPQEQHDRPSPDRPEPSAASSRRPSPHDPARRRSASSCATPPARRSVGAEVAVCEYADEDAARRRARGRRRRCSWSRPPRPGTGASSTARSSAPRPAPGCRTSSTRRSPARPPTPRSRSGATTTTPSRRSARAGWTSPSCATTSTSTCCRSSPTRTGVIRGPAGEGRVAAVARADVADVAVDRAARPGRARRRDVHPHRAGGAHDGRGRRPRRGRARARAALRERDGRGGVRVARRGVRRRAVAARRLGQHLHRDRGRLLRRRSPTTSRA